MLYEAEGNLPEARKRYERVLELDRSAGVASNNLAVIYSQDGGNLDLALQLAQVAKQKMPEVPEVSDTIGWIYVKKGLLDLGIASLEDAAGKRPGNPEIQFHLASAYLESGDREKARKVFDRLAKLSPGPALAAEIEKARAEL
jgi:tetratricopeptide (TPR) repeat protein